MSLALGTCPTHYEFFIFFVNFCIIYFGTDFEKSFPPNLSEKINLPSYNWKMKTNLMIFRTLLKPACKHLNAKTKCVDNYTWLLMVFPCQGCKFWRPPGSAHSSGIVWLIVHQWHCLFIYLIESIYLRRILVN